MAQVCLMGDRERRAAGTLRPMSGRDVLQRLGCRSVMGALAPVLALCLLLFATGCVAINYTKAQVRDRWVATYVQQLHITKPQAECIVDRFFGEISDDELKPLTKGKDLTDAEVQRIAELALACGVGRDTSTPVTV